ncbi:MAG: hypothetical protein EAZ97_13435 [Bacteroidetes bacterium]|nr:MAG: hypothetical protein EAZ97_13435 [Bacteroidota bacterium]
MKNIFLFLFILSFVFLGGCNKIDSFSPTQTTSLYDSYRVKAIKKTDRNSLYTYDSKGRILTWEEASSGYEAIFSYYSNYIMIERTGYAGLQNTYRLDLNSNGYGIKETFYDFDKKTILDFRTYEYDANGNLSKERNNKSVIEKEYTWQNNNNIKMIRKYSTPYDPFFGQSDYYDEFTIEFDAKQLETRNFGVGHWGKNLAFGGIYSNEIPNNVYGAYVPTKIVIKSTTTILKNGVKKTSKISSTYTYTNEIDKNGLITKCSYKVVNVNVGPNGDTDTNSGSGSETYEYTKIK